MNHQSNPDDPTTNDELEPRPAPGAPLVIKVVRHSRSPSVTVRSGLKGGGRGISEPAIDIRVAEP